MNDVLVFGDIRIPLNLAGENYIGVINIYNESSYQYYVHNFVNITREDVLKFIKSAYVLTDEVVKFLYHKYESANSELVNLKNNYNDDLLLQENSNLKNQLNEMNRKCKLLQSKLDKEQLHYTNLLDQIKSMSASIKEKDQIIRNMASIENSNILKRQEIIRYIIKLIKNFYSKIRIDLNLVPRRSCSKNVQFDPIKHEIEKFRKIEDFLSYLIVMANKNKIKIKP